MQQCPLRLAVGRREAVATPVLPHAAAAHCDGHAPAVSAAITSRRVGARQGDDDAINVSLVDIPLSNVKSRSMYHEKDDS